MNALRQLADKFPDSLVKEIIRRLYYFKAFKALRTELSLAPILETGLDGTERTPYAVLRDKTILFGKHPSKFQRRIYSEWSHLLPTTISSDTIGVAIDVITRYLYPHAMPNLTMPYGRKDRRRAFHPQHADTIADFNVSYSEKVILKNIFSPRARYAL